MAAGLLIVAIIASGLFLDLATPFAQVGGVLYLGLIVAAFWLPWYQAPLVLAIVGTILIAIGYPYAAAIDSHWLAAGSRGLAIGGLWFAALLLGRCRTAATDRDRAAHLSALIDTTADGVILIDAAGTVHKPAGDGARIVSLVPSITELLFDLGLGHQVVGRTAYCVHPKGRVKAVKSVGGTKTVRFDKLRALDPTHAIVNIDETGRYFVSGRELTLDELEKALKIARVNNPGRASVILRADRRCQVDFLVAAMNACNRAKIHDYKITARKESG